MHKEIPHNAIGPSLMYSERWEVDHLCNRFGLCRATARNIVRSYTGDRSKMQQEAERLAKYENLL